MSFVADQGPRATGQEIDRPLADTGATYNASFDMTFRAALLVAFGGVIIALAKPAELPSRRLLHRRIAWDIIVTPAKFSQFLRGCLLHNRPAWGVVIALLRPIRGLSQRGRRRREDENCDQIRRANFLHVMSPCGSECFHSFSVKCGPQSRTSVPQTHEVDMEPVRTRINGSALNTLFAKAE